MADLMEDRLYLLADAVTQGECLSLSELTDMLCSAAGLDKDNYESYPRELAATAEAIANELVDRRKDCEAARDDAASRQTDESEEAGSLRALLGYILFTLSTGARSNDGVTAGMCGYIVDFAKFWIGEHEAGNDER